MRTRGVIILALGLLLGLGPVAFANDDDARPGHYAPMTLQAAQSQKNRVLKENLNQRDILESSQKMHDVGSVNILEVPSDSGTGSPTCRPQGFLQLNKKIDVIDVP